MRGLINTHKNEKKASYQASIVVILIACVGYNAYILHVIFFVYRAFDSRAGLRLPRSFKMPMQYNCI